MGRAPAGRRSCIGFFFALACLLYVLGVFVPTIAVSIPLNEVLAAVGTPLDAAEAQEAWQDQTAP